MRLWHKDLIPVLPRQQLMGQWRECCAIARNIERNGTPNHVLVNKVMNYPMEHFNRYAYMIFEEMKKRGYKADWGKFVKEKKNVLMADGRDVFEGWHNGRYLRQCLYNLEEKADCGAISREDWITIVQWNRNRFSDR